MIAPFATQPALCSPFRRESLALGRYQDTPLLSAARLTDHATIPQHRAGGHGRNAAMASSICWNSPRETMTSAI